MHTGLTGVGTDQLRCPLYHRSAIGDAVTAAGRTTVTVGKAT